MPNEPGALHPNCKHELYRLGAGVPPPTCIDCGLGPCKYHVVPYVPLSQCGGVQQEQPYSPREEARIYSVVTFSYYKDKDDGDDIEDVEFAVPDVWLWSAESLAGMFNKCRMAFLGEDGTGGEAWTSWHMKSIRQSEGFMLHTTRKPSKNVD